MDRELIHPSHEVTADDSVPDPHSPGWRCAKCEVYTCALCRLYPGSFDDDLIAPCPGIPWYEADVRPSPGGTP